MFVPINGPVVADTAYVDDKLAARDVSVSFPEVVAMTAELQAMGSMSLPIWQRLENMETAITKIGVDVNFRAMIKPGMHQYEFRWVQTVTDASGNTRNVGCKAFIKGVPTKIPSIALAVGEPIEGECTFMTTRYALFVDGMEMFLIDRLAGIVKIDGEDFAGEVASLL